MGDSMGISLGYRDLRLFPNKTVSYRKEPGKYCLRGAMLQVIKGMAME